MNFLFFILLTMISAFQADRNYQWSPKTMVLFERFRSTRSRRLGKARYSMINTLVKPTVTELGTLVELATRVEQEMKDLELNKVKRSTGSDKQSKKSKRCKQFYWKSFRPCL